MSWVKSLILRLVATTVTFRSISAFIERPDPNFFHDIDGISVANGHAHLCVIEQKYADSIGGRAQCWGLDSKDNLNAPKDVDFVQLIAGLSFSCGITVEQTVICWGSIKGYIPGLYRQITAASEDVFACGVLIDGSINCWGHSLTIGKVLESKKLGAKFVQISCSSHHCCALDTKAFTHCWGSNQQGELIVPNAMGDLADYIELNLDTELQAEDERTVSKEQFKQLSVGAAQSCGLTLEGGHLRCWGLEAQSSNKKNFPKFVQGPFRQLSVGGMGICAIRDIDASSAAAATPDTLDCWGNVKNLIDNTTFEGWDQVSVGSTNACGVSMDSELACWGQHLPAELRDHHKRFIVA